MAGQVAILDTGFVVNQSGGVARYSALVQGPNDNEVSNPSGQAVGGFLGIAQEDQDDAITVTVRMQGISLVRAAGAITHGSAVVIANTSGEVESHATAVTNAATVKQVIGTALQSASAAGDLILMHIAPQFIAD